MSRTVKQDIDLLFDIERQVISELNPDWTKQDQVDRVLHYVELIFSNQNKWLLSDKISSEKQSRMDLFQSRKQSDAQATASQGGEETVVLPPTERQVALCRKWVKLGKIQAVDWEGKSKQEVSELIDRVIKEDRA